MSKNQENQSQNGGQNSKGAPSEGNVNETRSTGPRSNK